MRLIFGTLFVLARAKDGRTGGKSSSCATETKALEGKKQELDNCESEKKQFVGQLQEISVEYDKLQQYAQALHQTCEQKQTDLENGFQQKQAAWEEEKASLLAQIEEASQGKKADSTKSSKKSEKSSTKVDASSSDRILGVDVSLYGELIRVLWQNLVEKNYDQIYVLYSTHSQKVTEQASVIGAKAWEKSLDFHAQASYDAAQMYKSHLLPKLAVIRQESETIYALHLREHLDPVVTTVSSWKLDEHLGSACETLKGMTKDLYIFASEQVVPVVEKTVKRGLRELSAMADADDVSGSGGGFSSAFSVEGAKEKMALLMDSVSIEKVKELVNLDGLNVQEQMEAAFAVVFRPMEFEIFGENFELERGPLDVAILMVATAFIGYFCVYQLFLRLLVWKFVCKFLVYRIVWSLLIRKLIVSLIIGVSWKIFSLALYVLVTAVKCAFCCGCCGLCFRRASSKKKPLQTQKKQPEMPNKPSSAVMGSGVDKKISSGDKKKKKF